MARPGTSKRTAARIAKAQQRSVPNSSDILLLTAERLYAERGLDGVSLREIAREADQKNNSALHYHFGSKDALLDAIIRYRMREVDALRNDYLDRCETEGRTDLRAAVEALVRPLAHGLLSPRPDNYYNRFLAAAQIHPDIDLIAHASEEAQGGFRRVYSKLEQALPRLPPALLRQRYLTGIALITFSLADFERIKARKVRQSRGFDMSRAVENLIDMTVGALAAPVSDQVKRRLEVAEPASQGKQTLG
ncbi:helix-turn-helix transcriptional regulator [Vineibacter terrae]|uniref:Helix-turn-helix transcriptional regulator n=1 Tax=Vineibacter terrae TaxID=2586908 RepID=A0A5C8PBW5_9HYPH|nr:helix-turn-helix transcriptional regulator [Vineibacter terrae]